MSKITMVYFSSDEADGYISVAGHTVKRDSSGELTANGNSLMGRWVLRDSTGQFIDYDQYRTDLMERNDLDSNSISLKEHLTQEFA